MSSSPWSGSCGAADRQRSFSPNSAGTRTTSASVGELVEAVDERHVRINIVEEFSPGLVLHALSAGIGSVVDRELVMAHEQDGDLGAAWLQTKSAGSGPFRLRSWQANESVVLDANPHYRHGAPGVRRVILRHVPEPSSQRGCCWSAAMSILPATSRPT